MVARRLREVLRDRGLAHQWWSGRCTRRAPLPYEPFAGLLRSVPGDSAAWLAEAHAAGADGAGLALVAGFARRVRAAAAEEPVVLVVDDVDGADASTLRLLSSALPLLDDVPVLVVFAGRSDEAGAAPHELGTLCDQELAMSPLDPDDIAHVIRDVAPDLDRAGIDAVVAAAGGRPSLASRTRRGG